MGMKSAPQIVGYSESPVNMKNTGATFIFKQQDTTKLFFPLKIRIYMNNASGVVSPATISIGTNASSYNNILIATALTGVSASGTFIDFNPTFPLAPIQNDTDIYVNVTVGANATTFSGRLAIYGNST